MLPPHDLTSSLPMPPAALGAATVEEIATTILAELDHFAAGFRPNPSTGAVYLSQRQLATEPFIAYLEATHNGTRTNIFICRNETPHDFVASNEGVLYVSYKSPAGALASQPLGSEQLFTVKSKSQVRPIENRYVAYIRDEFRPQREAGSWDAVENRIAWRSGATTFLRSLRKREELTQTRRRVAVKVELPDQAILDGHQDTLFRKPLTRTVIIDGAPGTGKSSVLIKRLAQKTRWDFLEEAERSVFDKDQWDFATQRGSNWYLFTPSELLRHYLKEALSREALPATNETVKVWDSFKRTLLRDSRFLKVGTTGVFQTTSESLLKRNKSSESVLLAIAFEKALPDYVDEFFRSELRKFAEATRRIGSDLRDQQTAVFERALLATGADATSQQDSQRIAALGRRLNEASRSIDLIADKAREQRTDKSLLSSTAAHGIREQALATVSNLQKVAEQSALFPSVAPLAEQLIRQLQSLSEHLTFGRVFDRLGSFYQDFRQTPNNLNRFFGEAAEKAVKDRRVDAQELDVLLYVALKQCIDAEAAGVAPKQDHSANVLLAARRSIVGIDEATDFSALEIASMRLLSIPRALTVCGDPMQRLTTTGLVNWEELDDLVPERERFTLEVSYRQTERLLSVCRKLYEHIIEEKAPFRSAYEHHETDPSPLHFKSSPKKPAAKWVADRIVEIYEINGGRLPAVGVLVPKIGDVRRIAEELRPLLQEQSIEIEASEDGHALGDSDRVRVFAVEHIKGLEFESAFFLDIDAMADAAPDLITRYLYVGLSRARSFLGVTYSTQFPRRLQPIRGDFADRESFQ